MSLANLVISRRLTYLRGLEATIGEALDRYGLFGAFKEFMLAGDAEDEPRAITDAFLRNAARRPFFVKLQQQLEGQPFSWKSLKALPPLFSERAVERYSLMGMLAQVDGAVDDHFQHLLEAAACLPGLYAEKRAETNCLGAAQTIAALYCAQGEATDLRLVEVYDTTRREAYLRELRRALEQQEGFMSIDFDTNHGYFNTEDLREMLLYNLQHLEATTHAIIKNEKSGEFYDTELEVTAIAGSTAHALLEGIFLTTFANYLAMLQHHFGEPVSALRELYERVSLPEAEQSLLWATVGLDLFGETEKERLLTERILSLYGSRAPHRFSLRTLQRGLSNQERIQQGLEGFYGDLLPFLAN